MQKRYQVYDKFSPPTLRGVKRVHRPEEEGVAVRGLGEATGDECEHGARGSYV